MIHSDVHINGCGIIQNFLQKYYKSSLEQDYVSGTSGVSYDREGGTGIYQYGTIPTANVGTI